MTCMLRVILSCLQMQLKTLETSILKYELDPAHFLSEPGVA